MWVKDAYIQIASTAPAMSRSASNGRQTSTYLSEPCHWSSLQGFFESIDSGTTTIVENAHHNWDKQSAFAGWNASQHSGARVH